MPQKCDIGIIGMAVMGQNLALNIARKGFSVAVFNRTAEKTRQFFENRVKDEPIYPAYSLEEFIDLLRSPKKVMLMVKAGKPVESFLELLFPLLEAGDLILDGGNSHFQDTERRIAQAEKKGLLYLGVGISGGEEGALNGPSIMPGGHRAGYELVEEILKQAAAQADGPCTTYLGPGGAGHFVKMVHNGIEYAIMQAIAECYDLFRKAYQLKAPQIGQIFDQWNQSPNLQSYLLEISSQVLQYQDQETKTPLVDLILDQAEQKGTGKWTSQTAFDLGVPTPTINQSVITRTLSSFSDLRQKTSNLLKPEEKEGPTYLVGEEEARSLFSQALFLTELAAFSEGFHLLYQASSELNYHLSLPDIARIWQGGCILQAPLLKRIQAAFKTDSFPLLFATSQFKQEVKDNLQALVQTVTLGAQNNTPLPCLGAALSYYQAWQAETLPTNLIQAQRDYFGAHTYRRIDREGIFHTIWKEG